MYLFQSGGRVGGCVRQLMDKQALRSASTDSEKVRAPFSKVPCLSLTAFFGEHKTRRWLDAS